MPITSPTVPKHFTSAVKKPLQLSAKSSLTLFVLITVYTFHRAKSYESGDSGSTKKTLFSLKQPEYCPPEYLHPHNLTLTDEGNSDKTAFRIGDSVTVQCHLHYKIRSMFGNDFDVYPTTTRKCLLGGVWSWPRPICASKIGMFFNEMQSLVEPSNTDQCFGRNDDDNCCSNCRSHVGSLRQALPERSVTNNGIMETYRCSLAFEVPHFFNAAIVKLAKDKGDLLNVTLLVDGEKQINNISKEARNFQHKDFEYWYEQHYIANHRYQEYPIVNMSTYTSEIVVYYSIIRKHVESHELDREREGDECGPAKFRFFRILEAKYGVGTTTSEDERINHRRPVPPIIPNARAIYSSEDRTTLRFQCANGYILTKAKTDEIFNGEVIFDGEDWNPYPLPVCRAIIEEHGKPWNDSACGTGQHQINISPERSAQHAPNADKGPTIEDLSREIKIFKNRLQAEKYDQSILLVWVYTLASALGLSVVLLTAMFVVFCKMRLHQRSSTVSYNNSGDDADYI